MHPCPLPCHPPSQACPPCDEPVTRPCHCSKTSLQFTCAEATAAAAPPARLCCGKACHRALAGCPHTCERPCHAGGCTSQGCSQEVTVRCACKRAKRKLPCSEVQRMLAAATGSAAYDGATVLRLLPCEPACAKAAAAEAAGGKRRSSSDGAAADGGAAAGAAAAPAASLPAPAAAEAQQPRRKLTKEEREAEREAARQAKLAAQQRKQAQQAVVLGLLLLVAVVLALGVRHLLLLADRKAQETWGYGAEL